MYQADEKYEDHLKLWVSLAEQGLLSLPDLLILSLSFSVGWCRLIFGLMYSVL